MFSGKERVYICGEMDMIRIVDDEYFKGDYIQEKLDAVFKAIVKMQDAIKNLALVIGNQQSEQKRLEDEMKFIMTDELKEKLVERDIMDTALSGRHSFYGFFDKGLKDVRKRWKD